MSESILRTEKLCAGYGQIAVVRDILLEAIPGKILCLIGPNGAGKSTLLKTLIRELEPVGGAVFLAGRDLREYRERELARLSAAVLTGKPEPELMLCEDVVSMGRYPYTGRLGILSEEDRIRVRESMEKVGVDALATTDFNRISDGQRQRVLLARALCQEPRLLILDEPTSFLDIRHKLDFLQLLQELVRDQGLSVVMSMHELELAQRFSDLLLCIKDGKVDRMGTPEDIFAPGYIETLYGIEKGSYDALAGTAEAMKPEGAPRVFVLGGGGSGIPVYRKLQRLGIPFAAGVLPENDLDVPTARALAAVLITDRAFERISPKKVDEALRVMENCDVFLCTTEIGEMNRECERLLAAAEIRGIIRMQDQIA